MKKECLRHHWLIEPDRGPKSLGVCQHCAEHREFHNVPSGLYASLKAYMCRSQPTTYEREILRLNR